jgi:hypothetical protein
MIDNLVLNYMNNPRSIILAVIPANVDVATQKVDPDPVVGSCGPSC